MSTSIPEIMLWETWRGLSEYIFKKMVDGGVNSKIINGRDKKMWMV